MRNIVEIPFRVSKSTILLLFFSFISITLSLFFSIIREIFVTFQHKYLQAKQLQQQQQQ